MTLEKELREALKLGIQTLILQEVRYLRLERTFAPRIILDEVAHSIQETKKRVSKIARAIHNEEKTVLLRRMMRQAVDEEIERAIQRRKTKCIRCLHGRFYDETETAHTSLPVGSSQAQMIGCDKLRPSLRKSCRRFVEVSLGNSLEDYLSEITLLYEFREVTDRIKEIWKDYFLI